jgi:hypothetical protein
MNQLDNGKRITLTSKPSSLTSNEKISLSASTPTISSTIDSSKLLISNSLNSHLSHSLPSSPLYTPPTSLGVVPLSSTLIKDKIVVSTSSDSESNSIKSELVSEPTEAKSHIRRPLVSYEEEDSKGSSPEPQPVTSSSVKKTSEEKVEEAESLPEAERASSAPLDVAVEDQRPSTSSASSADPSSAEQSQKPKTKRVRISLKLDQLSVLRLERLASENPKLLRKLGLKAYRINNFNGSSKRFQIIRVSNPVSRPSESSINQSQPRGLRRPSRAPSASSLGLPFPIASPIPRFRAPYPHQRNISAFDFPKGNPSITPAFSMDRTQQLQPQQFQYPAQYSQQPQPQNPQYPQQAAQRPRYSSPVPSSMPPQQQQPPQQAQQQVRPTHIQEPGPSNNCSDSPLLVNLLSNNSQQPQQQPMQPQQQQQMRYPGAQQPQQITQQHQMMPIQHQGYPPQQLQQNIHMMQQQQYGYPTQRMPGPGQHLMTPGQMQQIGGQSHMMFPQGIPSQQMQAQQPVPQEPPAPKKRKRPAKKTKKDEEQAKAEVAAQEQKRIIQQQQQHPEYYMQQRMPQPMGMQQRMPPNYPYPGYPQGQQPSTSMMAPGYPPHGYPQQPQMWQPTPQEYASQYPMQMMRPTGQQQNPGTPTSGYPPPHQSPGYPQNPASQQQKVRTPSYPQASPQYPGQNPQQQAMNRQFMSPQNHPSPGYQQPPPQNQFVYPQGTQTQQQQQAAMHQNRQSQPIQQTPQQNTSGTLEDYGNFNDYNGASLEDLAATFGDLTGDECDLDSITPMNTDQMIPQHQQPQQQMMQTNQQQGIMHQQPQHNPQQQQQQIASYEQQQHQFVTPHMPPHQQSPMGYHPGQGYPQMTPHNQQDVQGHFQRPPSAGHPAHMQMYMHHQQVQQQQAQQQAQQQQAQQQVQQPPPPQQKQNAKNDKPPNGSNNDGYTTVFDSDIKSPPKANQTTQQNILNSIDFVLNKVRKNENEYFDFITTQWNNNPNGDNPAPAAKRKSKSTSSRPPSRQPKNSQPSSAAATPTNGPGPFFGGNSTGTQPSTPIKEEPMDFKQQERKNSTLSSLLSGSSTPTTMKCEENGHSEISGNSLAAVVKTESRDTETPQSVISGITSISPNNPPLIDAGVSKVEGNNGNHGTSPIIASNDAVALKTIQKSFSDNNTSTAADMTNAQMPPRKIRKTESSPTTVEDVPYFTGESDISTATS